MKRLAIVPFVSCIALIAASAQAQAYAPAQTYVDTARVIGAEPQYENLRVPRQECSNQWLNEPRRSGGRDYGGAVLGGVVGALLGNQVGGGHGREAATAVGAVVGAFAGDGVSNRDRWQQAPAPREVTTCRDVEETQSRLTGYRVTYDYRGQQFTTLLRDNPGRSLQVRVSVDPVGR